MKCVFPLFDSQRLNLAGPKQSTSSLLDCFFQINIFPKDLNPKQQPRLKSNSAQFLQVLGTVQSELVYSIAKMFILTLCLYMASTHINVARAWKYLQRLLRRYCFRRVRMVETTQMASQFKISERVQKKNSHFLNATKQHLSPGKKRKLYLFFYQLSLFVFTPQPSENAEADQRSFCSE